MHGVKKVESLEDMSCRIKSILEERRVVKVKELCHGEKRNIFGVYYQILKHLKFIWKQM